MSFRSAYRKWFRWTAVGFAALAFAVPGASAMIPHEAPAPADYGTSGSPGVSSPGVDWRDAGIGAAIGSTAGLLIGASLLLVGRRQDAPARV